MIVDFRVKPPYGAFLRHHNFTSLGRSFFRYGDHHPDSPSMTSMEGFFDEMDEAGIDLAVVTGSQANPDRDPPIPNELVAEVVGKYPERFLGFGGVDPSGITSAIEEIERCSALGLRGVSILNPWSRPPRFDDDEELQPLYDACSEHGLILSLTASSFVGPSLEYSLPVHIESVAARQPQLQVVLAHGAWPWVTQACALALRYQNLWLMPDIYLNTPNIPGREGYVSFANLVHGERILFASHFPVVGMRQSVAEVRAIGVADDALELLLGANAARLLRL